MEAEKMKKYYAEKYNFELYGYEVSFLALAIYELRRLMHNDEEVSSLVNPEGEAAVRYLGDRIFDLDSEICRKIGIPISNENLKKEWEKIK